MKDQNSTFPDMFSTLCPQCREKYNTILREREDDNRTQGIKQRKTIYDFHQQNCRKYEDFMKGLSTKQRKDYGVLVIQILPRAESWAKEKCSEIGRSGILYDILVHEAWLAAPEYDPKKGASFTTWVERPWKWVISAFRKVNQLQFASFDETIHSENALKETRIKVLKNVFDPEYGLAEFDLIRIIWTEDDSLCPYCRRAVVSFLLRTFQLGHMLESSLSNNLIAAFSVYAKRDLWKNLEPIRKP